jgi:methylmalonyl-CoA/ethylmalonyl-CoA epimerase
LRARLNHVGIVGKRISELAQVFEILGLTERTTDEPDNVQRVAASFLHVAGGKDVHLELLEPIGEDSPITTFLRKAGGGLHHLCFTVDDIEEATKRLITAGFQCVGDPVVCLGYDRSFQRSGDQPSRIAFFLTPARVLIELLEEG